jgi:hypothetical protein
MADENRRVDMILSIRVSNARILPPANDVLSIVVLKGRKIRWPPAYPLSILGWKTRILRQPNDTLSMMASKARILWPPSDAWLLQYMFYLLSSLDLLVLDCLQGGLATSENANMNMTRVPSRTLLSSIFDIDFYLVALY